MAATLRDVASAAGVHPGTVSRAMNPETAHLVNAATSRRVRRAAEELGYVPNPIARSLKTQKSLTLGVLIPDITNPLFPPIIRGFEEVVRQAGYSVLIAGTDNDAEREARQIKDLRARRTDGMLVATARMDDPAITELIEAEVPVVLVNRLTGDPRVCSVVSDDASGVRQALHHLRELGHTRIAHIAGPQDTSTGQSRYRAFRNEMRDLGLEVDEQLIMSDNPFGVEAGRLAMSTLLDRADFTAVLAGNDLLAIGACDVLAERSMSAPGDVSVVGFNDLPMTERITPSLTTVQVPHLDLGREAGVLMRQILAEKAAGRPVPVKSVSLPTALIPRGSTGPVARTSR